VNYNNVKLLVPLTGGHDFAKYHMFLDQHLCWSWINFPINQSDSRDKFRLRTRV